MNPPPVLQMDGIHKSFGGVHALRGARFTLHRPGQVHTLIGENGCGKSTLLGVLSGQLRPDAGRVELDGKPVSFRSPADAIAHGIVMVAQETAVAPDLSVAENVLLGRLPRSRFGVDRRAANARAAEALAGLGLDYDVRAAVGTLRPDQRQMIEIARALSRQARVIVLDEPTSSLTEDGTENLFAAVDRLRSHGVCVVFVSHRLEEVFRVSDEITVLRDGVTVSTGPASGLTPHTLVAAMVGDGRTAPAASATRRDPGPAVLDARGIRTAAAGPVDVTVHAGEVVGIAGLVGSGRSELLEALFGARPATVDAVAGPAGDRLPSSPRAAITHGIAFLPPDRRTQGLVLGMSVGENLCLAASSTRPRLRAPDRAAARRAFAEAESSVRLRCASPDVPVGTLSGGNQQKVALARCLLTAPRLLLLDEPTRGVDVAAKAEIHDRLRHAAGAGVAVLVSSSENEELLELCDRVIVLHRGRAVADLPAADADEATLTRLAGGHR